MTRPTSSGYALVDEKEDEDDHHGCKNNPNYHPEPQIFAQGIHRLSSLTAQKIRQRKYNHIKADKDI